MEKRQVNIGFGLAPIKAEGMIAHPDSFDNTSEASDEWYLKQLQGYKDWAGDDVYEVSCSRPHLLKELK